MNRINIDGRAFTGRSVRIANGMVWIDGVQQDGALSGVVEIRVIEGTIGELTTDASVSCGVVTGNIQAGGIVSCGDVGGSATAGGSMSCRDVRGGVTAGGSVNMRGLVP
jgi:hypothetical protein